MLRYLRRLADRDLALDRTMIPLGSCTMKLNATTEMIADHVARVRATSTRSRRSTRPRATRELFADLEAWLCEITGYDAVSLQPNAGSQGELAGLLAIRGVPREPGRGRARRLPHPGVGARHQRGERGDGRHAGGRRRRATTTATSTSTTSRRRRTSTPTDLAALMVTYPSTHGVFEAHIRDVCAVVHECGGQVYLDGANLNALVGARQAGRSSAPTCRT